MHKKFLSLALVSVLAVSLIGCSGKSGDSADATTEEPYVVEELATISTTERATEEEQEIVYGEGNIIRGGDFSEGSGSWTKYKNGGECEMLVNDDEELQVDITSIGKVEHGVQIYYDGFAIRQGGVYEISFDIHGTLERPLDWRIQVNGGDYHAYVMDTVNVTKDVQHVSAQFTMEEETDPAPRMCFNMGLVDTLAEQGVESLDAHSVMIDNVSLIVVDATNMIKDPDPVPVPLVKVNQEGYTPNATKTAVFSRLDEADNKFMVVDTSNNEVVFTGDMTERKLSISSKEWISTGDFSAFKKPGTYIVRTIGNAESHPFEIGESVYDGTFNNVVKMLYMQRCGMELTSEYAGDFSHPVCHNTEAVIFDTDTKIDVSGGWHDAGDYGRYVSSGAKAVADLLLAYEKSPEAFSDDMGIPESGNGISDILDEVRYELDWMLKMQDGASGGVYHKVTCEVFPETVMPQDETDQLIVCPISNCATGDFAAVMAMASRVYKDVDDAFSQKCLEAAKKAYDYVSKAGHETGFRNPGNVVTGDYNDNYDQDEVFWAGAELYKVTGDTKYQDTVGKMLEENPAIIEELGWANVGAYGAYAYLTSDNQDSALAETVKTKFLNTVQKYMDDANDNGYMDSNGLSYVWGSNMIVANHGMMMLMANEIAPNDEYVKLAMAQLHYLMGVNGTGYCFITGSGTVSPEHPHHRPSQVLEKCMPGMLVGGPDSNLEDPYAKAVFLNTFKALCYADNSQSFSCNEVTIYWNSPLIYLMANAKVVK